MLSRDPFEKKLNATIIPQDFAPEEKIRIYGELKAEADKVLPEKLYRFRRCNEYSMSAFANDEVWVSKSSLMNDGFDARPYVVMEEIKARIGQLCQPIGEQEFIHHLFLHIGKNADLKKLRKHLEGLSQDELQARLMEIYDYVVNDMIQASLLIPVVAQQTIKIGCFTEELVSPYMWGLYADNEAGFALEYDFRDMPAVEPEYYGKKREAYLCPVLYGQDRYNVPTEYVLYLLEIRLLYQLMGQSEIPNYSNEMQQTLSEILPCPDETVPEKISLHKSELWKQETEWRLFVTGDNDDIDFHTKDAGCCIKKPTALYLGRRVSSFNERILRTLANEKGIPVYKMGLDDHSPSYQLVVEK
ncbi:MAG: DUF2971 domain-containing protein [Clostridia bacterium]|nr:DUF2971 domain-containing protein [Clostridia bacterium]